MTPIAFLDIETTGLDPERHEIIEIAVQRVDPVTLHPLRTLNMKVAFDLVHKETVFDGAPSCEVGKYKFTSPTNTPNNILDIDSTVA